jgi:hypothetical protein
MRIVHFAISPMAGAPLRLIRALRAHAGMDARLVDLTRSDLFGHDVVLAEQPEEAYELARSAEVIHLHNYLTERSPEFLPIDFAELARRGARLVRHFHSTPELVAGRTGTSPAEVVGCPLPQVVIAQYPERFYPRAMVLPNLIPQDDAAYLPLGPAEEPDTDLFFGPTSLTPAWEDRWNTKGAPETRALMERVAADTGCSWRLVTGVPLDAVLAAKRRSRIVLDDMVNGSYHLSGLEGLSQGKPVAAFLDDRSLRLLEEFSGVRECPFVNVRLEDGLGVLGHLVLHPEDARAVGAAGREFMERHWSEARLAGMWAAMYRDLLEDPTRIRRQAGLALDGQAARFMALTLPDLSYRARRGRAARG